MLTSLPGDLIEHTFSFLDQNEVQELRTVCREIKKHLKLGVLHELILIRDDTHLLNLNAGVFRNLKKLVCVRSLLTQIPHIKGLTELWCYGNQLTQIPHIEGLKILDCSNNQLAQIPHIKALKVLDCSNNQLAQIPHIEKLEELYCFNNQLAQIPHIEGCEIIS